MQVATLSHLSFRQLNKYIKKQELGIDVDKVWHRKLLVDYPDYKGDIKGDYKDIYMKHMDNMVRKYVQFLRSVDMAYYIYYNYGDKNLWIDSHGYDHTAPNKMIRIADLDKADRDILKLTTDITFGELRNIVEIFMQTISNKLKQVVVPDNKIFLSGTKSSRKTKGYITGDDIMAVIHDCHNYLTNDIASMPLFFMLYNPDEVCYETLVRSTWSQPGIDYYIKLWASF